MNKTALDHFGIALPPFSHPANGDTFQLTDPSTGLVYADIPGSSAEDVDQVVNAAHHAMHDPGWKTISAGDRERLLHRFADEIDREADYLARLEALNTGRPLSITQTVDIPAAVSWMRQMAGAPSRLHGRSVNLFNQPNNQFHTYTRREPVGVVAAIVPWNFPLVLTLWKVAPALASGCAIIIKPSRETPSTALHLVNLARRAGLPDNLLNTLCGGAITATAMIEHPLVKKVAFTGSTATGQKIAEKAIPQMKRISLELGGKSPAIIMADANLEAAIPEAALGCFFNSGQVCYAGTRLYVQRPVFEQVAEGLKTSAETLKIGPAWEASSVLGPLISARQKSTVQGFVERAKADGADILFQINNYPEAGYYFGPTVINPLSQSSEIVQQEVFGPVLTLTPFDDVDEVIAMANGTQFGLAANVWTQNLATAHQMAAEITAGTVFVNCALLADPTIPFGGFGMSGIGRENGEEVFNHYLEDKSVVMKL